jgi:hypothetical protein
MVTKEIEAHLQNIPVTSKWTHKYIIMIKNSDPFFWGGKMERIVIVA